MSAQAHFNHTQYGKTKTTKTTMTTYEEDNETEISKRIKIYTYIVVYHVSISHVI